MIRLVTGLALLASEATDPGKSNFQVGRSDLDFIDNCCLYRILQNNPSSDVDTLLRVAGYVYPKALSL